MKEGWGYFAAGAAAVSLVWIVAMSYGLRVDLPLGSEVERINCSFPRVVWTADSRKYRVVETSRGRFTPEKTNSLDALGLPVWRRVDHSVNRAMMVAMAKSLVVKEKNCE
jgi:hypothetical protein